MGMCFNTSDGSEEQYQRILKLSAEVEGVMEVPPGDPLIGRPLHGGRVITACPYFGSSDHDHRPPPDPPPVVEEEWVELTTSSSRFSRRRLR